METATEPHSQSVTRAALAAALHAATAPLAARIESLTVDLARAQDAIAALLRNHADAAELAQRARTRLEAADRGTRLGRPPGSRGSAAHALPIASQDDATLETATDVFPDLRSKGDLEAISECINEAVTLYAMQALERGQTSSVVSLFDLEAFARAYQADMHRGWPFGSTRHFGRRLGMARDELLAQGIRVSPMRSTKGKRFWKVEQLAQDGFPVAAQDAGAAESQARSGDSAAASAR